MLSQKGNNDKTLEWNGIIDLIENKKSNHSQSLDHNILDDSEDISFISSIFNNSANGKTASSSTTSSRDRFKTVTPTSYKSVTTQTNIQGSRQRVKRSTPQRQNHLNKLVKQTPNKRHLPSYDLSIQNTIDLSHDKGKERNVEDKSLKDDSDQPVHLNTREKRLRKDNENNKLLYTSNGQTTSVGTSIRDSSIPILKRNKKPRKVEAIIDLVEKPNTGEEKQKEKEFHVKTFFNLVSRIECEYPGGKTVSITEVPCPQIEIKEDSIKLYRGYFIMGSQYIFNKFTEELVFQIHRAMKWGVRTKDVRIRWDLPHYYSEIIDKREFVFNKVKISQITSEMFELWPTDWKQKRFGLWCKGIILPPIHIKPTKYKTKLKCITTFTFGRVNGSGRRC